MEIVDVPIDTSEPHITGGEDKGGTPILPLYDFEPGVEAVLDAPLPKYLEHLIYLSALLLCGLRACRPTARDEVRDRQRGRSDEDPDPSNKPGQTGRDHPGDQRDRRRSRRAVLRNSLGAERMTATTETTTGVGRVARVTGPVIDVEFPAEAMPELFNALTLEVDLGDAIEGEASKRILTLEVEQHIGDNLVRAISMQPTDGVVRAEVKDTGHAITVPVGDVTLGHVWNTLGIPWTPTSTTSR